MVSILNPGYILPSRTHFTKLMEKKYQEALQKIECYKHHQQQNGFNY